MGVKASPRNFRKLVWEEKTDDVELALLVRKKHFAEQYHISPDKFDELDVKLVDVWTRIDEERAKKLRLENGR